MEPNVSDQWQVYLVSANAAEMIKSLGLAQAFDFGGCGGWI
jgi:hypothetical protein